jgi:hypothetical protein
MAIFACKFVVGKLNAIAPETLRSVQAAIGISALYGAFVRHRDRSGLAFVETSMKEMT